MCTTTPQSTARYDVQKNKKSVNKINEKLTISIKIEMIPDSPK